jgi:cell division protease FtsH
MYRPEDDRFLHTQSWLRHRMCGLLGGTIAEELVYGEFSDGATSDLQRVTDIARRMVTDFGMSPKLGRVSYQTQQSAYLPGGSPSSLACSETTAREIELEVRRLIDEALEQTRQILTARRSALDAVTDELMIKETIDAEELDGILERHPYQAA